MSLKLRAAIFATAWLFSAATSAAVNLIPPEKPFFRNVCHLYTIEITGEINEDTLQIFTQKLAEISAMSSRICGGETPLKRGIRPGLTVKLNSNGGKVDAAMNIGRTLRKHRAQVFLERDAECSSACAFIFAGGAYRHTHSAGSRIGVHRPFFGDLDYRADPADIRKRRDRTLLEIESFLKEVDVSTALLDLMLSVPPNQMRYLTDAELKQYRLVGTDPGQEELEIAHSANTLGLTSHEYRRRLAAVQQKCSNLPPLTGQSATAQYLECKARILGGD